MNKLLTKIVGAVLGASMAVGVGVGVAINNDRKDFNSEVEATTAGSTYTISSTAATTITNNGLYVLKQGTNGFTGTISSNWAETTTSSTSYFILKAVGTSSSFTLENLDGGDNKYIYCSTAKKIAWGSTGTTFQFMTGKKTTTISNAVGNGTVGTLQYNASGGFRPYTSATGADAQLFEATATSTKLTGITLGGAASSNAMSIGSSDLAAKTVTVTLNPSGATDQKVNIAHQSGTSGLFTVSSSATCTSGSGSFTVTGKGNTSGSETFRISGNTETSVYVDLVVTALDDSAPKYTVTYVHGDHGTGNDYVVNNVPSGSYTLATFATAGFTASSGYAFKKWSVDDVEYAEGASVTISDDTTVTAVYEEAHNFVLVTDVSKLVEGTEFIIVSRGKYPANGGTTYTIAAGEFSYANSKGKFAEASVTLTDGLNAGSIATSNSATVFTLSGDSTGWTIGENGGDKVLGFTNTENQYMNFTSSMTDTFTITAGSSNSVNIDSKSQSDRGLRMNLNGSGSGAQATVDPRFSNYGSTAQNAVYMFAYIPPQNELSSIALSGDYKTSFNSGDTFSFGGTVTASYTIASAANVTSSTTFHLDSASGTNMSGVTMTHAAHDGHTIYAKYTEGGITKTATYAISVANAPVSSLTIASNTGKVALNEYFDMSEIGVTILPTDAVQTYEWTVLSNTVNDDYEFAADIVAAKDTAGTITLKCTSTADSSKYQTFVLTVSGSPVVTLPNSISLFTGKTTTVAASVEGGTAPYSYSWSITSGGSYSSITSGGLSATVTLSGTAAGTVTLQCTVTDSNSKSDSASVTFSVVASVVTSVSWSASSFDVFSGATIPADIDNTWEVNYEKNNGDADYLVFGDYELYLGNKVITSLPYTFVAADDGKTLHVEYGGVSSSSVAVTVTQTINTVTASTTSDWDYTFTSKQFTQNDGETEVTLDGKDWVANGTGAYWGYDGTKGQQFGSGSSANTSLTLTSSDFGGTVDSVIVYTSGAKDIVGTVQVSVGGTAYGDAETLTSTNTGYTFDLGGKSGDVVISYTQTSSKAIYIKEIVVNTVSGSTNIANNASHKAAQRVAVKFANAFNAAMDETENCTKGLDAAWSTCSSAYNTFKSEAAALGSTEEAWAKNLIKYATAQYSDDSGEACIERMMKTYEVCVQKHGKTAFMSDLKTIEPANGLLNPISGNNVVTTVTVIISVLTLTTLGGYFLLRKRKEEN